MKKLNYVAPMIAMIGLSARDAIAVSTALLGEDGVIELRSYGSFGTDMGMNE